jgi:GNAT superfamily N-acetyltransferase
VSERPRPAPAAVAVRPMVAPDVPFLPAVERAAGLAFRELGMAAIAEDEPPPQSVLAAACAAGRGWVASDEATPVAYLLLAVVDGAAHIEQVSVHPGHARQGLGRRLIDEAEAWARLRSMPSLTLTTFRDVPWNAPYYRRLGFADLAEADLGPGLDAVRRHEAEAGLEAWPRVAMRRAVRPGPACAPPVPRATTGREDGARGSVPPVRSGGVGGTP